MMSRAVLAVTYCIKQVCAPTSLTIYFTDDNRVSNDDNILVDETVVTTSTDKLLEAIDDLTIGEDSTSFLSELHSYEYMDVESLKKLNKNKKLAKNHQAFLASKSVIKQIPPLLRPGLNKYGNIGILSNVVIYDEMNGVDLEKELYFEDV
ncbi:60S ribosomal protein L10a [Tanacetum coccineum]